jgi:hypothetical protein
MIKQTIALFTIVISFFVFSQQAEAISGLSATCERGALHINWSGDSRATKWAITVDDTSNPWSWESMYPGDLRFDSLQKPSLSRNVTPGNYYHYTVRDRYADGGWGPVASGTVLCTLRQPTNTNHSYSYPYLTLTWDSVPGAVRYVVHIDDREKSPMSYSPEPFNPDAGDRVVYDVTTNSYRFKVGRDRLFTYWVHAIDRYGNASKASRLMTVRTN